MPPVSILVYNLQFTCPSDYNHDISSQGPAPLKAAHILSELAEFVNQLLPGEQVESSQLCAGLRTRGLGAVNRLGGGSGCLLVEWVGGVAAGEACRLPTNPQKSVLYSALSPQGNSMPIYKQLRGIFKLIPF